MLFEKLNDPRDSRNIPTFELASKTGRAVIAMWKGTNSEMTRALLGEKEVIRRVFVLWTRMEEIATGGKKKTSGKKTGKRKGKQERRVKLLWLLYPQHLELPQLGHGKSCEKGL